MGMRTRSRLTTKHGTRDITYDLFIESRLFAIFQTRQTVGRYRLRKAFTGLTVTVSLTMRPYLGLLY